VTVPRTARFLYDGDALAIETDGAGGVLRAFAHGPGSDEPLVWYEVPGGWRRLYPRADHQGSIVAAGGDNGALALINRYDEYGIPAGTNTGRFQYTGQIWIPELGMYHYKARVYSPTLGRFLQTDPVGYQDQFNLYAYVGNDPVNGTDPTGMFKGYANTPTSARKWETVFDRYAGEGRYRFSGEGGALRREGPGPTVAKFGLVLDRVIASPRIGFFVESPIATDVRGNIRFVDREFGGGFTRALNPGALTSNVEITISGNGFNGVMGVDGQPLPQTFEAIGMHELTVEAEPRMNAGLQLMENENVVRRDVGDRERARDPQHPF
jgi:RHS repeat-associated protein